MVNVTRILKRSWHILWNYRVLWIFGFLLALTAGGSNPGSPNDNMRNSVQETSGRQWSGETPEWFDDMSGWFEENVEPLYFQPQEHLGTILAIVGGVILFMLLVGALVALVRYPVETAILRMVDEYEQNGVKLGFRRGWQLGWSRRALRIWVVDLIVSAPAFLLFLLLGGLGLVIYFNVTSAAPELSVPVLVAAIGLAFIVMFAFAALMVFFFLLRNFFVRAIALDDRGVADGLREGWALFKGNWKSAGLVWLLMIGVNIAAGVIGSVLFFLFIPLYLVLLLPAAFVAALPGLAAFGVASVFASGPLTWVLGILAAAPFFFVVLFAPMIFAGGWLKIYDSAVWTLTYREIKALRSLSPAPSALPDGPAT